NVFHYSLEPSKIMCGWDGMVRILGYGVSSVGKFTTQMPGVPSILPYLPPEQVRGETIDARSNLFRLGAVFYEMVTDHKAFDGEDAESVRQSILDSTPVPPLHLNPKLHPLLSDLIMKALSKDPGKRYQNGRELLDDLENCKESRPQAAKQPAAAAKSPVVPDALKAAPQSKFVGAPQPAARQATAASTPTRPADPKPHATQPVQNKPVEKKFAVPSAAPAKAAAAAAGWAGAQPVSSTPVKPAIDTARQPSASMSSSVVDEPAVDAPRI